MLFEAWHSLSCNGLVHHTIFCSYSFHKVPFAIENPVSRDGYFIWICGSSLIYYLIGETAGSKTMKETVLLHRQTN